MQRFYGNNDDTSQDSLSRTTRSSNKIEKRLTVENSKFLADFDPEKSGRERRKLTRKSYVGQSAPSRSSTMYDEQGRYRNTNIDQCDCLEDCPGCHCKLMLDDLSEWSMSKAKRFDFSSVSPVWQSKVRTRMQGQ